MLRLVDIRLDTLRLVDMRCVQLVNAMTLTIQARFATAGIVCVHIAVTHCVQKAVASTRCVW